MGDDDKKRYQLKLIGDGLSVDQIVDQQTAVAILNIALGGELSGGRAGSLFRQATPAGLALGGRERHSLKSFMDDAGARTIAAKIVVMGIFLRDQEGKSEFTRDDVASRFKNIGEAHPTNLPRDFKTAVRSGWLAEDVRNTGQFFVTTRGDDALASSFEGAPASTGRRRRRKKSVGSAGASSKD